MNVLINVGFRASITGFTRMPILLIENSAADKEFLPDFSKPNISFPLYAKCMPAGDHTGK